jgi:hypothetical protein
MTKLTSNSTIDKSDANLPTVRSTDNLPALPDFVQREQQLNRLVQLHRYYWQDHDYANTVALVEAASTELRTYWEEINQPSTAKEIAAQVTVVCVAYPNLHREDRQLFLRLLGQRLAARQPSRYVLFRACEQQVDTEEFLSIAAMLKHLEAAQKQADRINRAMHEAASITPEQLEDARLAQLEAARGTVIEDPYADCGFPPEDDEYNGD